jgi:hypothetical protein
MGGRRKKGTARLLVVRVPRQGWELQENPWLYPTAWARRKRGLTAKPTGRTIGQEKPLASHFVTVPHTDTGRQVEDTKARERTLVKELGNLTP